MADSEANLVETNKLPGVQIQVDFRPGHWGKVYHIFDKDGREIALPEKEAVRMARKLIKIAGGKEV